MNKNPVLIAMSLLAFVGVAHAQNLKIEQGDFEVSGSARWDRSAVGFDVRLGTFVDHYIQAGVYGDWMDDNYATRTGLGVYLIHLFETRTYALPYAGASLGFGSLDFNFGDSESGVELQFLAGLKYFLADNVSLNTELNFGVSSGDTFMGDRKTESTDVGLRVGISFFW